MAQGAINGRTVNVMLDTGATTNAKTAADAQRIGLDFSKGQPVRMNTANGVSQGYRVQLASVRVGDVEVYDVDAIVSQQPMPYILLGNRRAQCSALTTGFLKKLPALPITAGSGSLRLRIAITASLTWTGVGWWMPCASSLVATSCASSA